jgi:hypothetical protein
MNIKVEDDKLMFNDDPLHSDHVELWFSLPYIKEIDEVPEGHDAIISTSFIRSKNYIWLYKSSSNIDSMKKELENPHIYYLGQGGEWTCRYKDEDKWFQGDVDDFLLDLTTSELHEENIFFGVTHFGILPQSGKVVQYDTETYDYIENDANVELDDLAKYIQVNSVIRDNSYELNLEIRPEALGFVSKFGVKELRFLVDAVDMDSGKRQQSLLSTSSTRKWGEPASFNEITLKKPIKVKIHDDIEIIGDPHADSNLEYQILSTIPNTFVKTKNDWAPVGLFEFYFAESSYMDGYSLDNINKYMFRSDKIVYHSEVINNHFFYYFNIEDKSYLSVDNKIFIPTEKLVSKIFLPGGNIALLITEYDIHFRWQTLTSELFFLTKDSRTKLLRYFAGDLYIGEESVKTEWDHSKLVVHEGPENVEWGNILEILPDNLGVKIDLGSGVIYTITWDENGENIDFLKVE